LPLALHLFVQIHRCRRHVSPFAQIHVSPPRLPLCLDLRAAAAASPSSFRSERCRCVSSSVQIRAVPLCLLRPEPRAATHSSFVQIFRRRYVSFFVQICSCCLSSLFAMPTAASPSSSSSLLLWPLPLP
ncbi:hypothetical protein HN873_004250, partial [Arachis hypogaea]